MEILNALDLKKGKKVENNRMGTLVRPLQFLPQEEKTEEWAHNNLDWLEFHGMHQIKANAKHLMKNYKLAEGILDKTDYIVSEDNEYGDLIDILTREQESPLELKFYPLVPNILRIMCAEFAKRSNKVTFQATDDLSYNEMLEEKRKMIEDTLLQQAQQKQQQAMIAQGLKPDSKEAQQMMAPETLKSLPEIQDFFEKDYMHLVERWANVQHQVDTDRFRMDELELTAFKDSLITDREFWHFRMMEDDYEVELWRPELTFYHKSPNARYISQGNFGGKIELLAINDVIDNYGYLLDADQTERLEGIYPVRSAGYNIPGVMNDGSFYDPTKSHDWNTDRPSLGMRQFLSGADSGRFNGDILDKILKEGNDMFDTYGEFLIRVTTAYWKSQRKLGHLTKIDETGTPVQKIVTEDYVITDKPMYNTTVVKTKSKNNLIFGEHVDWIWINDVWGGIKIGPNRSTWTGYNDGNFSPIYIGIDKPCPSRLPFQFKGDNNLYGCKLPIEGRVFTDRNTRSISLVDQVKPFQVQYNLVNNQIADILVDELGTVITFDQNALPRHSMGEDWGKNNLAKAYVAMKNFQMLPFDTTITNTENAINFQHMQVLNMEQTNRLMGRVNLSNHFKEQAFEVVGITPQRRGQEMGRQTATGVEQNINASYAQTEMYFIQHSDQLMPRVHEMRTDLAQYYHSNNPSVRLQYMTTKGERINFEMNGTSILSRDLNIYCTTKANYREMMEKLKTMAVTNNTMGASIFDLGTIIKSESLSELDLALKAIDTKMQKEADDKRSHDMTLQDQMDQAENARHLADQKFQADQGDKNRAKDIEVAEIKSAGMSGAVDLNKNGQNDYMDNLKIIQGEQQYQDTMNFKRQQEANKNNRDNQKHLLDRQKMNTQESVANKQLEIARVNKNRFDKPTPPKSKK